MDPGPTLLRSDSGGGPSSIFLRLHNNRINSTSFDSDTNSKYELPLFVYMAIPAWFPVPDSGTTPSASCKQQALVPRLSPHRPIPSRLLDISLLQPSPQLFSCGASCTRPSCLCAVVDGGKSTLVTPQHPLPSPRSRSQGASGRVPIGRLAMATTRCGACKCVQCVAVPQGQ